MVPNHERRVLLEGQELTYSLRRSKRANRILLHAHIDGTVEVVVPWHVAFREAERFVEEKRTWLARMCAKHKVMRREIPRRRFVTGTQLPYFGDTYALEVNRNPRRKRTRVRDGESIVTVFVSRQEQVRSLLERWYIQHSRDYFIEQSLTYAKVLGAQFDEIKVRNAKTRWGSCSRANNTLSFHWRLALAPVAVAQYVVAHEVAHLKHSHHSQTFWDAVALLSPDYERHRRWLRECGHTLVL